MGAGKAEALDYASDGLINLQVDNAASGALRDSQGLVVAVGGNVDRPCRQCE